MNNKPSNIKMDWITYTDGHREKYVRNQKGVLLRKEYYQGDNLFRCVHYSIKRNLPNLVVEYNENKKPISVKRIVYDVNGYPIQKKNYSFQDEKNTIVSLENYFYGVNHTLEKVVCKTVNGSVMWTDKYSRNEKSWTIKERFNSKNKKVESTAIDPNGVVQWKRLFSHDAEKNIVQIRGYQRRNNMFLHAYTEYLKNDGTLDRCETYNHDVKGNKIGASCRDANRKELWHEIYNYLGKGIIFRESFENVGQRTEELYNAKRELVQKRKFFGERLEWQENYLYKNHKLTEMVRCSSGHVLWREAYDYNKQGLLARVDYFDDGNELNSSDVYEYNDQKQKIKVKNYDAKGHFVGTESYVYDEKTGKLINTIYRNKYNKLIETSKVESKEKGRE